MDLDSLNTIAILEAQEEYMNMNEEDALNEENAVNNKKMEKEVGLRLKEEDEVGFYLVFLWFSFFIK
ncbi:hypothetical protein HID58_019814 [Brassica napus]|uniref:Uncharacterized protein n=1 Tax=Brassica napus TaxID=3708 RepID=A0ABQ8DEC7_BRANA|nr:hypothetical protein HID58_019814 [Brassica napus]